MSLIITKILNGHENIQKRKKRKNPRQNKHGRQMNHRQNLASTVKE